MSQPNENDTESGSADAARHAREQAKEYDSPFAPGQLTFDDGSTMEIPPDPRLRMLDDDCLEAYDELLFESESYDRGPDVIIPEHQALDKDGKPTGATIPEETVRGPLLTPYRKDGVLVKPPWEVKVVRAALGGDKYAELRCKQINGRSANAGDVWKLWSAQGLVLMERQAADPKSGGSSGDLAPVAAPDSE